MSRLASQRRGKKDFREPDRTQWSGGRCLQRVSFPLTLLHLLHFLSFAPSFAGSLQWSQTLSGLPPVSRGVASVIGAVAFPDVEAPTPLAPGFSRFLVGLDRLASANHGLSGVKKAGVELMDRKVWAQLWAPGSQSAGRSSLTYGDQALFVSL